MEEKLRFDVKTTQKLVTATARIDLYKGKWQQLEKKDNRYLKELRTLATIQSIGSSTRIEGATLTNAEVETLLRNMKVTKFRTRDEHVRRGDFEISVTVLLRLALRVIPQIEKRFDQNLGTIGNRVFDLVQRASRRSIVRMAILVCLAEVGFALFADLCGFGFDCRIGEREGRVRGDDE